MHPLPPMFPAIFCLFVVFLVLTATGVIMLARASRHAPEGFEDARGFHALDSFEEEEAVSLETPLHDSLEVSRQMEEAVTLSPR